METYNILKYIAEFPSGIRYVDVLNGIDPEAKNGGTNKCLLEAMLRDGLITGTLNADGRLELTPKGAAFLDSMEQENGTREEQLSVLTNGFDAHATAIQEQNAELRRQADAQERFKAAYQQECADRARDDKKYFWLGIAVNALVSVAVTLAVTYITRLLWP